MQSTIEAKSKILKAVRDYFDKSNALEVCTDILRDYPNLDSNIYPLEVEYTLSNGKRKIGYLHTSPEYEMKKILADIKKDIYQITKVFRNFEGSKIHKIEFTMLEWYRVNYNLFDLMEDTKNLFIHLANALYGKPEIEFKGKKYNLEDWEFITVEEAFYRYAGVDISSKKSMAEFIQTNEKNYNSINLNNWEEMFYLIYGIYIEKNLGVEKPTFIYMYPKEVGALAEVEGDKALRFEAYIGGLELVNGYQELRDKNRILKILKEDAKRKELETGKKYPVDQEFVNSIDKLPPCSGASLGLDRAMMILLNIDDISNL